MMTDPDGQHPLVVAVIVVGGRQVVIYYAKKQIKKKAYKLVRKQVKKKVKSTGKVYTKSNLKLGQQMHKSYKADKVLKRVREKEFRLPSGKRIDFIDFEKKIIYELKPNNPQAIKQGRKQLEAYKKEVERIYGKGWRTKLELY
jgi:hypothetical protein